MSVSEKAVPTFVSQFAGNMRTQPRQSLPEINEKEETGGGFGKRAFIACIRYNHVYV